MVENVALTNLDQLVSLPDMLFDRRKHVVYNPQDHTTDCVSGSEPNDDRIRSSRLISSQSEVCVFRDDDSAVFSSVIPNGRILRISKSDIDDVFCFVAQLSQSPCKGGEGVERRSENV